jgi:hypothetical protein
MNKIRVKEDIRLPGSNIILEKGDVIFLKESFMIPRLEYEKAHPTQKLVCSLSISSYTCDVYKTKDTQYPYAVNSNSINGDFTQDGILSTLANLFIDTPSLTCKEGKPLQGDVVLYKGMFWPMDDPRVIKMDPALRASCTKNIVIDKKFMKEVLP